MFKKRFKNIKGYYHYNFITTVLIIFSVILQFFRPIAIYAKNGSAVFNSLGFYRQGSFVNVPSIDSIFDTHFFIEQIVLYIVSVLIFLITFLFYINKYGKKIKYKIFKNSKKTELTFIILFVVLIALILLTKVLIFIDYSHISNLIEKKSSIFINDNITLDNPNFTWTTSKTISIISFVIMASAILFNFEILKEIKTNSV